VKGIKADEKTANPKTGYTPHWVTCTGKSKKKRSAKKKV